MEHGHTFHYFVIKGVKTNNGLSIDSTTKLLEYKLNSDCFNINASNQLSPLNSDCFNINTLNQLLPVFESKE